MANIATFLQKILDAVYGEEVRGSIHDALAAMNVESSNAMEFAATAKDSAKVSADSARTSASTATQKAGEALASAGAAKVSETNAKISENNAVIQASDAAKSAANAKTSETAAGNSEAIATQKAQEAADSQSAAALSEAEAKAAEDRVKTIRTDVETLGAQATVDKNAAEAAKVAAEANWNYVTQQTADWDEATARTITQSVIDSGKAFNVIYAENNGMARGAVAALDANGITHGKDGDVIVMGFDSDKWAFEEVLAGRWNYMGLCNPLQAETVDSIIKDLQAGKAPAQKIIYTPEQGFDAATITPEDVATYGT